MSRLLASPERFAVAAFDALLANIAILDSEGKIIAVNLAWERFAQVNAAVPPSREPGVPVPGSLPLRAEGEGAAELPLPGRPEVAEVPAAGANASGLGINYLAICDATTGADQPYASSIAADIRAVLAGETGGETEYPCELPDGMHYYLARVSGFVQDGGRYAVVAHEDITRRKLAEMSVQRLNSTLEQRVQERSHQLEAQNDELRRTQLALEESGGVLEQNNVALVESNLQLAQFAHVASHDLQEPLRIVGAYSDMLRHRYAEVLDARAQGYLNHITEQVTRARQMVRDVLSFSSVGDQQRSEAVDLESLWKETVHLLTWPPGTELHCGPLPKVQASQGQLRQLLTNLLGNSLKFHAQLPLEISLTRAPDDVTAPPGMAELVLRDNGVGIAPEYRSRVFGMFQRLHSRTASGGNGIGLAICKRIVEQHGGSIWVGVPGDEQPGEPHRGTAIHFTLPLAVVTADEDAASTSSPPPAP